MNDTSREAFRRFLESDEGVVKFGMALSDEYISFALGGWDACESAQAEQAKLIAELVGELSRLTSRLSWMLRTPYLVVRSRIT